MLSKIISLLSQMHALMRLGCVRGLGTEDLHPWQALNASSGRDAPQPIL
jgi:hypothetical protein